MKRLILQVNHKAIAFILITLAGCKNEGSFITAARQEITASAATSLNLDSSDVGVPAGTVYTYTAASGATHDVVNLDMGADFLVTNICSTKSILSLTGTAICNSTFGDLVASNMHRVRAAKLFEGQFSNNLMAA
jgi:hypothetical protein